MEVMDIHFRFWQIPFDGVWCSVSCFINIVFSCSSSELILVSLFWILKFFFYTGQTFLLKKFQK